MNDADYCLYYSQEDILVIYSFEDDTLREDTFYGFEYGTMSVDKNRYFWSVNWDSIDQIRHKVLLSDYTEEEFKVNFINNEHYIVMDYMDKYTIQDILNKIE